MGCYKDGNNGFERTRYYSRQLVTADDLTQDQHYLYEKRRLHNRLLHGWGIVCGAEVNKVTGKSGCVTISPGYILTPTGDEVIIFDELLVDLHKDNLSSVGCQLLDSPGCSEIRVERPIATPLYISICYEEVYCRPQEINTLECNTEISNCEYSRIKDGFRIQVLTELPNNYSGISSKTPSIDGANKVKSSGRECPECPASSDCWVILASVKLDYHGEIDDDIRRTERRYVVSFGDIYSKESPLISYPREMPPITSPDY